MLGLQQYEARQGRPQRTGGMDASLSLELVTSIIELRPNIVEGPLTEPAHAVRRRAIKNAVARLVR